MLLQTSNVTMGEDFRHSFAVSDESLIHLPTIFLLAEHIETTKCFWSLEVRLS